MLLTPCPISSKNFFYNSKTNTFSVEMSMLGNFNVGRVYDDACDEGFTMISERTGKGVVFAMNDVERDREGDIISWNFISVTPGHKGMKVVIFND